MLQLGTGSGRKERQMSLKPPPLFTIWIPSSDSVSRNISMFEIQLQRGKKTPVFLWGFSRTPPDTLGRSDCCQKWHKSLDWPCHPHNCRKSWWSWRPWRAVCSTWDDRLCIRQRALATGTWSCRRAHSQIWVGRVHVSAGWCCASPWCDRIYWNIWHPGQSSFLWGWNMKWNVELKTANKKVRQSVSWCEITTQDRSTFAKDIAMAPCQAPVKVKCTYSLYVAVSGAVKQHSLLNVHRALDFSQLCFLPWGRTNEWQHDKENWSSLCGIRHGLTIYFMSQWRWGSPKLSLILLIYMNGRKAPSLSSGLDEVLTWTQHGSIIQC